MAIVRLNVKDLYPHPDNPRKELGDLTEMVDSIKKNGILQNLTVVKGHRLTKEEWISQCKAEGVSKGNALACYDGQTVSPDGFTVIIGHRRLAAAKLAGLETVPCHIALDMPEDEQFAVMMTENMQRVDLTPIEQIEGMQYMLDLGFSEKQISEKTGFSQKTVKDRLKVSQMNLDKKEWKEAEGRGGTIAEYLALAKVEDPEKRAEILKTVGTRNFNDKLNIALEEQKTKARRIKLIADLSEFAIQADFDWGKHDSVKMFYPSQQNEVVKKPEDGVQYYYDDSPYMIRLFKDKSESTDHEVTQEQKKKQIHHEWIENQMEKLDACRDRFFNMRVDFVKEISETDAKKHLEEILPYTSQKLVELLSAFWTGAARDTGKYYFKFDEKKNGDKTINAEAFLETQKEKPYRTLLFSTVCSFDSKGNKTHSYEYDKQCVRHLVYTKCKALEAVYELLSAFGYEMSEDEERYVNGKMIKEIIKNGK